MTVTNEMIDSVRNDFASFALTGSKIEIEHTADKIDIRWTQGKQNRHTEIRVKNNELAEALVSPDVWVSYKHFLGSESMADLRFIATRILDRIKTVEHFTPVMVKEEDENSQTDALGLLVNHINTPANGNRTGVFFLRGEAGCGKSILLKELARTQAQAFLEGRADRICLYIDAQGKALLSLHDAFSSVCDDLSITSIRKDTIPILCRHNLLIPLVDGFDELLGSGGFGEAFNSLGAFLADLDGQGQLIASGRSTFYDQQQLQITASRFSESIDYTTSTAEVLPWGEEQIRNYCAENWKGQRHVDELMNHLNGSLKTETNRKLLGKPFFSAEYVRVLPYSPDLAQGESLADVLIKAFVERESGKWLDRQGNKVLPLEMHLDLLSAIAEEMWWSNTRELDLETIRTLTELQVEKRPAEHRNIAIQRSSYHGCLQTVSSNSSRLGFQHAIYFEYFLHRHIARLVESRDKQKLQTTLDRDILSESLLDLFALMHAHDSVQMTYEFTEFISSAAKSGTRHQASRQNLGALVAALIDDKVADFVNISLLNLDFVKVNLRKFRFQAPEIKNCVFENVRLNGTKLIQARIANCRFDRILVDEETHLDCVLRPGDDVTSIIYKDSGLPTYNPVQIRNILEKVGSRAPPDNLIELTPKQSKRIDTLERFLKKMERNFYVGEDLEIAWGLSRTPEWSEIKRLLYIHGLLEPRKVPRRGPTGEIPVLTRTPEQIRRGQSGPAHCDSKVAAFWYDLYEI